jgi:hypothetical protein
MAKYSVIGTTLPNRRRNRRTIMPAVQIDLDGQEYTTVDWSLGGVLIGPYDGHLGVGHHVQMILIATVGGEMRRHQVAGEIARRDYSQQQIAVRFERIDPETVETLERVVMERFHRLKA